MTGLGGGRQADNSPNGGASRPRLQPKEVTRFNLAVRRVTRATAVVIQAREAALGHAATAAEPSGISEGQSEPQTGVPLGQASERALWQINSSLHIWSLHKDLSVSVLLKSHLPVGCRQFRN